MKDCAHTCSRLAAAARRRLESEDGFTMIELLDVMLILSIVVMIALPSYMHTRRQAALTAAQSNVNSAVPAAIAFLVDPAGGNGLYSGISRAKLAIEAPGISSDVKAAASAGGTGYCIEDSPDGTTYYSITGGAGGTGVIALGACSGSYPSPS